MNASAKKLNEMNRLGDMGHFPAKVNAGATANVVLTLIVTWLLVPHYVCPAAPIVWVAIVLAINLLPVIILRSNMRANTNYPTLREMDFIRDQHKFSDWVYLAASANMAFWVLTGWALFSVRHNTLTLALMLATAAFATFSPVLLRAAAKP